MGSRPSSSYAGTNGTLTNQAEAALRTENNQLKDKIDAFEKLEPDKLKQENEELKRLNGELQTQLQHIRDSQKSPADSSDHVNNKEHTSKESKEKHRSKRIINSNLTPQRISDIDAYGQGLPLEKHPDITIKSRRKRHKKKYLTDDQDESKRGSAKETNNDQSQEVMSKGNEQRHREPTDESLTQEKDPDPKSGTKKQQKAIESGQSLGSTSPCLSVDEEKKSFQESDLLS